MMAYPTKILPDLLNGTNSEFVLNNYEAKKMLLVVVITSKFPDNLCIGAHWRYYYYNPSKNPIDCPRSGSITIADFGWISYNKKITNSTFPYTTPHYVKFKHTDKCIFSFILRGQ